MIKTQCIAKVDKISGSNKVREDMDLVISAVVSKSEVAAEDGKMLLELDFGYDKYLLSLDDMKDVLEKLFDLSVMSMPT